LRSLGVQCRPLALLENRKSPDWGFRRQTGQSCTWAAYWLSVPHRGASGNLSADIDRRRPRSKSKFQDARHHQHSL
jgi:hypothetical protein